MKAEVIQAPETTEITRGTPIEELSEAFLSEQDVKESTRSTYKRALKQFFDHIEAQNWELKDISRKDIIQYKKELLNAGNSTLTVASYLNVVKLFYKWTETHKIYPNVAAGVHAPKRKRQHRKQALTIKQAAELLDAIDSARDYALINLILRTGLRTFEVANAKVNDITIKGSQRVLMIASKGYHEKTDFVILTDKVYKPLQKYLTERNAPENAALFTSQSNNNAGGALTTRSISRIAKKYLKEIGLTDKSYTAHSLRHTAAANILRSGGTIQQAKETLRHSDISTTQIYLKSTEIERRLNNSGESLIENLF